MRKATKLARTSALPAIAAALALSSTPLLAQQTQPVTTEPSTAVTPAPAPTPTPAPETAPSTVDTSSLPAADTTAPVTKTVTKRTVTHTTHVAAARRVRPATHVTTSHAPTHAAAPAAAPAPAAPPAQASRRPPPVVEMNAKPAQSPAPAAKPATAVNNTALIAGGVILALLIIAIAAFTMARSRRRRRQEQEWADERSMAYEPFETAAAPPAEIHHEQPAIIAPDASAFAWGDNAQREASPATEAGADDDRRPGETWVERAYRGPSAANPSVSLKARLKRAAFFDKRERDAAAGLAEPVDPSAGLPEAMVEDQAEERELA